MFQPTDRKITKAEVLLTRRCNIQCGTCDVIGPAKDYRGLPVLGRDKELTAEQWKQAFDVVYDKLGGTFVALYGGEPLVLDESVLDEIVMHLASKRSDVNGFTIISNALLLSRKRAKRLVDCGLDSWTSSVDTFDHSKIGDGSMVAKSQAGVRALTMMKNEFGLRDTCGIITVTAKNIDQVLPTVQWLTDHGHWAGIDVLHYQRGDGQFTFSSSKEQMQAMGLLLNQKEHGEKLAAVADALIKNHSDLLVFPTRRVLEMWKSGAPFDLGWKCTPGHAITIDSDGSIGLCDDRMPNKYGAERKRLATFAKDSVGLGTQPFWKISDFNVPSEVLNERWAAFLHWYGADLHHCSGCFWSTHVMAVDALHNEHLRGHYVHRVLPKDL